MARTLTFQASLDDFWELSRLTALGHYLLPHKDPFPTLTAIAIAVRNNEYCRELLQAYPQYMTPKRLDALSREFLERADPTKPRAAIQSSLNSSPLSAGSIYNNPPSPGSIYIPPVTSEGRSPVRAQAPVFQPTSPTLSPRGTSWVFGSPSRESNRSPERPASPQYPPGFWRNEAYDVYIPEDQQEMSSPGSPGGMGGERPRNSLIPQNIWEAASPPQRPASPVRQVPRAASNMPLNSSPERSYNPFGDRNM